MEKLQKIRDKFPRDNTQNFSYDFAVFSVKIVYEHMCYTKYGFRKIFDEKIFISVEKIGNFY